MTTTLELSSYDQFIVAFSGGKDSVACLLHLLDQGVPKEKIELWHHDVDGREGSSLMDWACTASYCRAFAKAFDLPLYFSWKVGGFEGEMTRNDTPTAQTAFETPHGIMYTGGKGQPGTRLRFPQVSADLSTRWCSAYLKIDVGAAALRNQERFNKSRTLFITGERAEESSARAKYKDFEPHRADNRSGKSERLVDQWRPVHSWTEEQVWDIMKRYLVNPHPAYRMGWGRVSCAACIFGSANQWASLKAVDPEKFSKVSAYETKFGVTIKRKESLELLASRGTPYASISDEDASAAKSHGFDEAIFLEEGQWKLPAGAFGEGCGPT